MTGAQQLFFSAVTAAGSDFGGVYPDQAWLDRVSAHGNVVVLLVSGASGLLLAFGPRARPRSFPTFAATLGTATLTTSLLLLAGQGLWIDTWHAFDERAALVVFWIAALPCAGAALAVTAIALEWRRARSLLRVAAALGAIAAVSLWWGDRNTWGGIGWGLRLQALLLALALWLESASPDPPEDDESNAPSGAVVPG
ncbi:MAG TPA: hypothetical protein VFF73_05540 [Planctomycetota bacterium]|nr:hypothetical protein [Planctomycetota bacterium]